MPYTDENGWSWHEHFDGTESFGNGYVIASISSKSWITWYPTGAVADEGTAGSREACREAALASIGRLHLREMCARFECDEYRGQIRALKRMLADGGDHA
jgi:hypothetical protein